MKKIVGLIVILSIVGLAGYHALMFYDNNFIYGRMRETPAVRPHEEPLLIMEAGVVPTNAGEALYRISPGSDLTAPMSMTDPAVLARGKAVYMIYCAQCHGTRYDGNGTVGQSFQPLPTDLKSAKVQSKPEGELFKSVSYGIPGGRQPALQTTVTIDDRWRVIAHVKSLGLRK